MALSALLGLALGSYWLSPWKRSLPGRDVSGSALFRGTPEARPAGLRPERPVYRHSVIPGGAYSVSELERAERRDPVVAAHYARFDHAHLRIAQNPAARLVYVSYRVGDEVYWTRGRVQLAAAETLITDGENEGRARCGNRVSGTPRQPTLAHEPPAAALDEPEGVPFAGAPAANAPPGPMLAPEIFPAPGPLRMAGYSGAPGLEAGVSGGSGGGFGGGFPAWGGGGGTGLPPWQNVAPQAPVGQIPAPRVPGQPFPQSVPVVWVASNGTPFFTPSPVSSAPSASGGAPALPSGAPVPTSFSFTPIVPFVPLGGGTMVIGSLPGVSDSGGSNSPANPNSESGAQPPENVLSSPQPDQPPEGPQTPQDTPEPGTGLLAAAGALAMAGLAAFRNRRNRTQ